MANSVMTGLLAKIMTPWGCESLQNVYWFCAFQENDYFRALSRLRVFFVLERILGVECSWMPAQRVDRAASLVASASENFELLSVLRISY